MVIGFAVRNLLELERVLAIEGVSCVEIKLDKFAESGCPIYFYRNGRYLLNSDAVNRIKQVIGKRNIKVLFHLPIERNVGGENGLNMGLVEYHQRILERFIFLEEVIYKEHGMGDVVTFHFSPIQIKNKIFATKQRSLRNTVNILRQVDICRQKNGSKTFLAIENIPDDKQMFKSLGHKFSHFQMLKNMSTIGMTIDVGHAQLAEGMNFLQFEKFAKSVLVANCHFHGNGGESNYYNWKDDEHLLPTKSTLTEYDLWVKWLKTSILNQVIVEINLSLYTDSELIRFIKNNKIRSLWE